MSSDQPKSLDAAYERRAITQGAMTKERAVFEENRGDWGEPAPKRNNNPEIVFKVLADIGSRHQLGVKKYGTGLQPFNGRDALKDAYEEALDMCQYLRQALYERDGK